MLVIFELELLSACFCQTQATLNMAEQVAGPCNLDQAAYD